MFIAFLVVIGLLNFMVAYMAIWKIEFGYIRYSILVRLMIIICSIIGLIDIIFYVILMNT